MLACNSPKTPILLLLLLTLCLSAQQFECMQEWSSDGNYYNMEICMSRCTEGNIYQNVTNVEQLANDCCTPICQSQIAYHIGKRTAIIVVVSILLFFVLLCCIFGCCGPSIKKRWVIYQEAGKREVVGTGISVEQFDQLANQFSCVFTEEERENWEMYFVVEGQKFVMQWFTFDMKRASDYKYSVTISGQDIYGSFKINGYYVNTEKGPTNWGVKNYENIENSSIYFEKHSEIVHQIVRMPNGDYEGVWYNRKVTARAGECAMKRKGYKVESHQVLDHFQILTQ